jgi:hypothetical protein
MDKFYYNDCTIRFDKRDGVIWVNLTDIASCMGDVRDVNNWIGQPYYPSELEYRTDMELGYQSVTKDSGGNTWAAIKVAYGFVHWYFDIDFLIWFGIVVDKLTVESDDNISQPKLDIDTRLTNIENKLDVISCNLEKLFILTNQ